MENQFLANNDESIQNRPFLQKFYQNKLDMKNDQIYQEFYFQNYETEKNIKNKFQTQQNSKIQWDSVEQKKLYQLHDKLGNRWAIISNLIIGKTENAIKNHLFSKLRKGLRKVNKVIQKSFKKQIKQLKMIVIYKIIEGAEQRFKQSPSCDLQTSDLCTKLKNRILELSDDDSQLNNYDKNPHVANDLIKDLVSFTKQYKRKNKKSRKNSNQSQSYESIVSISSRKIFSESGQTEKCLSPLKTLKNSLNQQQKSIKQQLAFKTQKQINNRKRAMSSQQIYFTKQTIINEEQNLYEKIDFQSKLQYSSQNKKTIEDFSIFEQFVPPFFQLNKKGSHLSISLQCDEQPQKYHYFQQSQKDQFKNFFFFN